MAQQIINVGAAANDRSGDTWRDAMIKANANFTELYTQGNTVFVQTADDFPDPIAGVRQLETKAYIIVAKIDLGTDVLSMGEGTLIQGYTAEISGITTNSASPLLSANNLSFEAVAVKGGLQLDNLGIGPIAHIEGTTIAFFQELLSLDSGTKVLEVVGCTGGFSVDKWTCVNGTDGIVMTGVGNTGPIISNFNPVGLSGKGIDIQGDIASGALRINDAIISVGGTAVDVSGNVQGMSFSGDAISTTTGNGMNISGTIAGGLLLEKTNILSYTQEGMDIRGSTISDFIGSSAGITSIASGKAALIGDAASANITNNAIFQVCQINNPVDTTVNPLSGITKKDLKYSFFKAGARITDSTTVGAFTFDATTSTTINFQGDDGTITAFADAGSGNTTVSTANTPASGAPVAIYGTTSYNGLFTAANVVAGVSFDIVRAFVANDATGNWESGWEKISGGTTLSPTSERFDLPNDNELRSLDSKTLPLTYTSNISADKSGSTGRICEFALFLDRGDGNGFVKENGSFELEINHRVKAITVRVPTEASEGTLFTIYGRNMEGVDAIEVFAMTSDVGIS